MWTQLTVSIQLIRAIIFCFFLSFYYATYKAHTLNDILIQINVTL